MYPCNINSMCGRLKNIGSQCGDVTHVMCTKRPYQAAHAQAQAFLHTELDHSKQYILAIYIVKYTIKKINECAWDPMRL